MDPIEQLAYLYDAMKRAGAVWWVDSGTLLGLARQGDVLPWDSDIDLGCWAGSIPSLALMTDEFRRRDYRVSVGVWRRRPYRLALRGPGLMPVDVKLWWRDAEVAVCPSKAPGPSPYQPGTVAWAALGLVRRPVRLMWEHTGLLDRWVTPPGSARWGVALNEWRVPARFFDDLGELWVDGITEPLPVPADMGGYLSWRYGDWRTPVEDWVARRDDPAFTIPG